MLVIDILPSITLQHVQDFYTVMPVRLDHYMVFEVIPYEDVHREGQISADFVFFVGIHGDAPRRAFLLL
jgi:hypothetical protein